MTPSLPTSATTALSGLARLENEARASLTQLQNQDRLRTLVPCKPGDLPLDLTHNDYLGLRTDTHFQQMAMAGLTDLPAGSGASRLLGGEHPIFRKLEQAFAAFKGAPGALYFGSGYAANEALGSTLASMGGRIFSDSLNHASIIDGIRLSGLAKKDRVVFPHGDLHWLETQLKRSDAAYNLIFSESLFSMDGDKADLAGLWDLAQKYRGVLVIDEAHAIGCMGTEGKGLTADSLDQSKIITINTCGKALGVSGAFICGPSWLRDLLINRARPFIYTTAPSPWMAAALLASIQYLPQLASRRKWLASAAQHLKDHLNQMGYHTGASESHIIPILCGPDGKAVDLASFLVEHGVHVRAIRPPTVPEGTSRVRLSLHAGIDEAGLTHIIDGFRKAVDRYVS